MIRVLQVLPTLKRAGAERVAVSLACHLERKQFASRVVSLYNAFDGGFEPVVQDAGIPLDHLGKHRGPDPSMIPSLRRIFRQWQPHIIQTHSYVLRYVLPAHWGLGTGLIVHTVHNEAAREVDWVGRLIHRIAFHRGVAPVAVGSQVASSFHSMYGFLPAAVIPNGIDLVPFAKSESGQIWRQRHGFDTHQKIAVVLARLEPQKDPLRAVEAFRSAVNDQLDWHLVMAGNGSLRGPVEALVARSGLSNRVHFVGLQPDIPALLSAADLFMLTSRYEGRPMAVMEAMAAGLPIVATAVGGIEELVAHQRNGLLAPPGDTESIACALRTLMTDNNRRIEYGCASRALATAFGLEPMVNAYTQLYKQLLSEATPPSQEVFAS